MVKIAVSANFFTAYSRIPKNKQRKVQKFIDKFMYDPTQRSINYEPIYDMKDNKVRTVRIDGSYRAIVIHPPKGNTYLLVWVDHHDEAMDWAKNKVFEVNKQTGALQVIDTKVIEQEELIFKDELDPTLQAEHYLVHLFDKFTDDEILLLGVPEILLPSVRAIITEAQLDRLQEHLPEEAYEGLLYLAAGFSIDETLEELCRDKIVEEIDTEDFAQALENPDTKRRFAIFTSSEELMEMLKEPLAKWRIFLHPYQKRIVEGNYNGPIRVTGGAGTGKTVVAMHRAKYLAENIYTGSGDRILLTTYTKNLAKSIENNLKNLCPDKILSRIEVVNLHAWAVKFLRKQGIYLNIASSFEINDYWHEVVKATEGNLTVSFYKEEWEHIIQNKNIQDLSQYLRTPRIGRGTRLSRDQKVQVWEVTKKFKEIIKENNQIEWTDVIQRTLEFLKNSNVRLSYQAIIVDEGQDFNCTEYKLLREMVDEGSNDLFIVGDSHQRIYSRKVVLGQCGINIRGKRSKRLKINYRTTEEIRDFAIQLLEGYHFDDLDGGIEMKDGYKSLLHGKLPMIKRFNTYFDEVNYLMDYINSLVDEGIELHEICIVTRTKDALLQIYQPGLQYAAIPFILLDGIDSDDGEGVRLATMHRVKGLEFKVMILASLNKSMIPNEYVVNQMGDERSKEEVLLRERSLLYVASTRARDELLITSYGEQSPFLNNWK